MHSIKENCNIFPLTNMKRCESLFASTYRLWWPGCVQRNKNLCENIFGEETSWCHLIVLESKTSAAADSTGDVSNWWANSCHFCLVYDSSHLENVKVVMVAIVKLKMALFLVSVLQEKLSSREGVRDEPYQEWHQCSAQFRLDLTFNRSKNW